MRINANPNRLGSFCAKQNEPSTDKNPISKLGERETLLKGTVVAGLGVGARALFYLWENDFAIEDIWNYGVKLTNKNKKAPKSPLVYVGACVALTAGFIAGIAAIYTLYKTPEIMYNGKINAFKKGKDMDVYTKGNSVEKELYNQMNAKAKVASAQEKEVLKQQYLKLRAAKNQTPEFIQPKNNK